MSQKIRWCWICWGCCCFLWFCFMWFPTYVVEFTMAIPTRKNCPICIGRSKNGNEENMGFTWYKLGGSYSMIRMWRIASFFFLLLLRRKPRSFVDDDLPQVILATLSWGLSDTMVRIPSTIFKPYFMEWCWVLNTVQWGRHGEDNSRIRQNMLCIIFQPGKPTRGVIEKSIGKLCWLVIFYTSFPRFLMILV